jgi:3-methyladenine DNA glycosylase/8-oxoguanine DNA glycosylase
MTAASTSAPDRWAEGRTVLRAADPRMAALVDARPQLDPDAFFDTWPSELWSALVAQVIGQQISLAAAGAIRGRLQALHGGLLPTPAQASGSSRPRQRSPRWTRSACASGRGARLPRCTC